MSHSTPKNLKFPLNKNLQRFIRKIDSFNFEEGSPEFSQSSESLLDDVSAPVFSPENISSRTGQPIISNEESATTTTSSTATTSATTTSVAATTSIAVTTSSITPSTTSTTTTVATIPTATAITSAITTASTSSAAAAKTTRITATREIIAAITSEERQLVDVLTLRSGRRVEKLNSEKGSAPDTTQHSSR